MIGGHDLLDLRVIDELGNDVSDPGAHFDNPPADVTSSASEDPTVVIHGLLKDFECEDPGVRRLGRVDQRSLQSLLVLYEGLPAREKTAM